MSGFLAQLDHWQTLVSGVLAIIAAAIGSFLLWAQISQTDKHEKNRMRRHLNAVRVTLPLTLSDLLNFTSGIMSQLAQARISLSPDHIGPLGDNFIVPAVPKELVSSLTSVLEASDDPRLIAIVSEIAAEIQILNSRVTGLADREQMRTMCLVDVTIDQYLIQAARLDCMISSLFEFARREKDVGPDGIEWEPVLGVLRRFQLSPEVVPELYQAIEKRQRRLPLAWQP